MLAAGAGARTTAGGGGAAAGAGGGVVGVAVGKERKKTMISAARGPKDGWKDMGDIREHSWKLDHISFAIICNC